MDNHNRLRQRNIDKLTKLEDPLILARTAIDALCEDHETSVRHQLNAGADFDGLLSEPFTDPLLEAANTVLMTYRPYQGDASTTWTNWFHLQLAIKTASFRSFQRLAFTNMASAAIREHLHEEAYNTYGTILNDVLELRRHTKSSRRVAELTGVVSELAIAALLTKTDRALGGARMSSATADILSGVDLRYMHMLDGREKAKTISISVKTSHGWNDKEKLRNRVAIIVANDILVVSGKSRSYIAQLIAADTNEPISKSSEVLINQAAQKAKSIIHKQTATWLPK